MGPRGEGGFDTLKRNHIWHHPCFEGAGMFDHPPPPQKKKRQEQLSTFWPPKKLPPLPSVWTAVDAFDPARQGRTLETLLDVILLWHFVGFGGMV